VSWKEFSEQTGNRILELAPSWAIFVEGVGNLPDDPRPEPVFWAENLAPSVENRPSLIHSRKLVLSPHVYGM
jgi:aryl-phospho-beta-D-glucosidase BglC (GH1 family)